MAGEPLCNALLDKIHEQIERTEHLIALLPPEGVAWKPASAGGWPVGMLLGHLLDCLAGLCAALAAAEPARLAHFRSLRELAVNHLCSAAEAAGRIGTYRAHIEEGFAILRDADLARPISTVF